MSTLSCSPARCHRAHGYTDRADGSQPAAIWMEKAARSPSAQERLLYVPLFKIVDGKLQLNHEKLDKMADELPCSRLILRDLEKAVHAKRQRPDEPHQPERAKMPRPAPPAPVAAATPTSEVAAPASTQAPRKPINSILRAMKLPAGAAAGDRIRLFNVDTRKKVGDAIAVPEDAYEGMVLDAIEPADNFRLVFEDARGFASGGSAICQHGTRLRFHRKKCSNSVCSVLGCAGDRSAVLFDAAADDETCRTFEDYCRSANRRSLQVHINRLQARRYC